ncbi:MAG: hypothetical protein KDD02_24420 [Phaeodactylibacter sp.]|nr:hypothetical protein [Phaeodactylibacter sp.]
MTNQQQTVKLELTVAEVNTILAAIGKLPYIEVFQLINKIQTQGGNQMGAVENGADTPEIPAKKTTKSTK